MLDFTGNVIECMRDKYRKWISASNEVLPDAIDEFMVMSDRKSK